MPVEVMGKLDERCKELRKPHKNTLLQIRCYNHNLTSNYSLQLHIFCYAREKGFSSVVYFRMEKGDQVETTFVLARSRFAPLKSP